MNGNDKSKTIRPPGATTTRVSVACDRCRKKKIRCFYDNNDTDPNRHCANCKLVGLECIFTDKLARKAFPRGYTESLEERVRELEYENRKLQKLLTLKSVEESDDSKMQGPSLSVESRIGSKPGTDGSSPTSLSSRPNSISPAAGGISLNTENLTALNAQFTSSDPHTHDEDCSCNLDHSLVNRPVSIAGSVDIDNGELSDEDSNSLRSVDTYTNNLRENYKSQRLGHHPQRQLNSSKYSFEQVNAPGAAAAISLQNKLRTKNFMNLANLIATSIPRSTDETLFIPTLLAKLVKIHGFDSRAPYLAARSIALLKEAYNEQERYKLFPITFKGVNFNDLKKFESIHFFQSLNLPNHLNLDICITMFFETWNTIIPILNKEIFMDNYKKFNKSRESNFEDGQMVGFEKFGEVLVIITCLVMISNERSNIKLNPNDTNASTFHSNSDVLQFYDHLIKQLIHSNISSICSISSLQIKTIELLYCLTTGDLNTSYEVRGNMITMCQQMRLHRCPAAVLGSSGSKVSKLQQGERRILFWCIYTLESFAAFILGVPRFLKDYEIECALPSSTSSNENQESETNLITFNNNIQLSLVGKVCDSALSIMRFAKILGTIVDIIFKRNNGLKEANISESTCLLLEEMLNNWLNQLPSSLSFSLIERGTSINIERYSNPQLTLMFLYYQAKALIYMTLLSNEASSKNSPAFISTQQASTNLLTISKVLNTAQHNFYFLPLPMNIARQKARFALLAARNALEYTRGGSLFQEAKNLLNVVVAELRIETKIGLLGCLSNNSFTYLELAIDAILAQPKSNNASSSSSSASPNFTSNMTPSNGTTNVVDSFKKEAKRKSVGSPLKNVATGNLEIKKEQPAINDIFCSPSNTSLAAHDVNMVDTPSVPNIVGEHNNKQHHLMDPNLANINYDGRNGLSQSDLFAFMKADPKTMEEDKLNSLLNGNESKQHSPNHLTQMNSLTDLLMVNDFCVDASLGLSLIDFEDSSVVKKPKLDAHGTSDFVNSSARPSNTQHYNNSHGQEYNHRTNYSKYGNNDIFALTSPDVSENLGHFGPDSEELNTVGLQGNTNNVTKSTTPAASNNLFEWSRNN